MSCSDIYNKYGGQSMTQAATQGAFQGITGMLGLGGFWHPVSDSAITNIENTFTNVKKQWDDAEEKYKYKLSKWQEEFRDEQLELLGEYQKFGEEMLSERIGKNSLYIAILFVALIIVIIYLIVL